jgi:hypothetical protein
MTVPQPRSGPRKPLDAGVFQPEIGSFRLYLAAEGEAARTVRTCTKALHPASGLAADAQIPRCPEGTRSGRGLGPRPGPCAVAARSTGREGEGMGVPVRA